MKLSWGKPSEFKTAISTDGAPAESAEWKDVPIPKEGTLQLTPTEGQETIATEEGGDPVDVRNGKTTYLFEFDLFTKKGEQPLFDDVDGIVSGEHAFKLLPEDDTCEGIRIDRAKIVALKSYNVADGIITHIKARVLKPAEGKSVKPYLKSAS